MSGELALDTVTANQSGKEVTVNLIASELEAAVSGQLAVALPAAPTVAQLQRAAVIITSGAGNLTIPACKRSVIVWNTNTAAIAVKVGSTTLSIGANAAGTVILDGTANGAILLGGAATGSGSGSGGGSGGGGSGSAHKAWRIAITSTEANDGPCSTVHFNMAATAGGANVALNANGTGFSDAAESGHPTTAAFDGDEGTFWGGPTTFTAHIGMVYSTPQIVLEVGLEASSDGYWRPRTPMNFKVQYSDDTTTGSDGTWTDAWTVTQTATWGSAEARTFDNASPT